MPSTLVKSYAKKANKSVAQVEKIWDEAKAAAAKLFKSSNPRYWAYVNGTVRKRLALTESTTFKEFVELAFDYPEAVPQSTQVPQAQCEDSSYGRFISCLFAARDKAHELHLSSKSYAQHKALNELYDLLLDHADKMAESFQGRHGLVSISIPASSIVFDQTCANAFIEALVEWLEGPARSLIGTDSFIINQFEDLLGNVFRVKYKLDNLE